MHKPLCLIMFFIFLSCSSEKPAETGSLKTPDEDGVKKTVTAPGPDTTDTGLYSLETTPLDATRNSTLNITPKGFNLADAQIAWSVNNEPVTNPTAHKFKAIGTKKGDNVQAKVTIQGKEIFSNIITIKNAPPEISKVKILPEVFKPGDNLSVDVSGTDIDEDEVTITYEWIKNGEAAGDGKQIAVPLKRGDKVSVRITPFDGESYGSTVTLHREIRNLPPVIIEEKNRDFDGVVYTYQVRATDPDGDPLTYSLKTAPDGMTINKDTGLIRWKIPPDFKGKTPITVSIKDGNGGEATKDYSLEIKLEIKKETPSAKKGILPLSTNNQIPITKSQIPNNYQKPITKFQTISNSRITNSSTA